MQPWWKQGLGQLPAQDGAVRPSCPLCVLQEQALDPEPLGPRGRQGVEVPPWPWVFAPQQRFWCRSHSGDSTAGNTRGQRAQHQNGGREGKGLPQDRSAHLHLTAI